ncbi:type II TA system antitoxin MqsA family protein [Bacillus sp. 005/A4HT-01/001]|uniref:type II TA system antitoxin MqsA family protein n=1 Tax=Bacillus sp. 005/A4HT-01/001 TaxID=2509010 RepID=UPI001074AA4E|nr:type II TA system antitoxin MqsA family protein [Bacillus sp. 005/A4HT-01/001]TFW48021.1 helix-turn-helix domain-containing protein [Bacillus sp. 005/A4HT-01/001]
MLVQHFCPECLEDRNFKEVFEEVDFKVKEEEITIKCRYLQCEICNEKITDPDNPDENIEKAFDIYRTNKKLLHPDEIVDIREMFGLSQRDFAKILGWSHATVSRYETGALPGKTHSNFLKSIRKYPPLLLDLAIENRDSLSDELVERIETIIQQLQEQSASHQENTISLPKDLYDELIQRSIENNTDVNSAAISILTKSLTETYSETNYNEILSRLTSIERKLARAQIYSPAVNDGLERTIRHRRENRESRERENTLYANRIFNIIDHSHKSALKSTHLTKEYEDLLEVY